MKSILLPGSALLLCVSLSLPLSATPFTVQPKAGYWQGQYQVLVNGQDLIAQLQQLQQGMLSKLPAEQRQLVAAMLPKTPSTAVAECLSQTQVEQLKTPEQWLQRARRLLPNCQLQLTGQQANGVSVSGNCKNQRGYTGTLQGQLQLVSAQQMQLNMSGQGQYQMAGLPAAQQGPVQFNLRGTSRWLRAECAG